MLGAPTAVDASTDAALLDESPGIGTASRINPRKRSTTASTARPGINQYEIFMPGERGWKQFKDGGPVEVLRTHWDAFKDTATKAGLDVEAERRAFLANKEEVS